MTNVDAIIEFDKFFETKTTLIAFPQYVIAEEQMIHELIKIDKGIDIIKPGCVRISTYWDVGGWNNDNINIESWKQVLKPNTIFGKVFGEKRIQKFLKRLEDLMEGGF